MRNVLMSLLSAAAIASAITPNVKSASVYLIANDLNTPAYSYFRTNPLDGNGNEYGDAFIFDAGTEKGKQILAMLMTAKATGSKVRIQSAAYASGSKNFGGWAYTMEAIALE
jgi:hypothetical protein